MPSTVQSAFDSVISKYRTESFSDGKDTGIDIVCRTYDGEYWAVQCKCYQENKKVDLATVSTFITTSQFPFIIDGEQKKLSPTASGLIQQ